MHSFIFLSHLQVYFGTHHSRLYICANLIGPGCGTGMSWLIKKSAIDNEGGLKVFSEYLAEDFFIVKALRTRYSCYCLKDLHIMYVTIVDGSLH